MQYDKSNTCRGCLSVGTLSQYLYENDMDLIFSRYTTLKIFKDDNLPDHLCLECTRKLEEFDAFQKLCIKNDEILKLYFSNLETPSTTEENFDNFKSHRLSETSSIIDKNEITLKPKSKYKIVKQYPCTQCNKRFKTLARVESHIGTHFGEPEGICRICNKTFSRWVLLEQHLKIHNPEQRYLVCEKCGKTFYSKSSLKSHESVHSEETPFKCQICNKLFKRNRLLQAHLFRHTNIRNHVCAQCGIAFVTYAEMKKHTLNVHSQDKPFTCKVCGKGFKILSYLTGHMHIHTDKNKCDVCDKIFATSSTLKLHKRVHTGEKPFDCDFCHKSFSRKDTLLKHFKTCLKDQHKSQD